MKNTRQQTDEMTAPLAWQQVIAEVVDGKRKSWDDKRMVVAPAKIEEFIKLLGGTIIEPEDGGKLTTNGWQWDWWMDFEIQDKKFTASGSGYYGGFTFGPKEEF